MDLLQILVFWFALVNLVAGEVHRLSSEVCLESVSIKGSLACDSYSAEFKVANVETLSDGYVGIKAEIVAINSNKEDIAMTSAKSRVAFKYNEETSETTSLITDGMSEDLLRPVLAFLRYSIAAAASTKSPLGLDGEANSRLECWSSMRSLNGSAVTHKLQCRTKDADSKDFLYDRVIVSRQLTMINGNGEGSNSAVEAIEMVEQVWHGSSLGKEVGEQLTIVMKSHITSREKHSFDWTFGGLKPLLRKSADIFHEDISAADTQHGLKTILTSHKDELKLLKAVKSRLLAAENPTKDLKDVKASGKFGLVLDAAASTGLLAIHQAVMKVLPIKSVNSKHLERYFTSLSFAVGLESSVMDELKALLKKPWDNNLKNVEETVIYTVCRQLKYSSDEEKQALLHDQFLARKDHCSSTDCLRQLINCITALRTNQEVDRLLDLATNQKDSKTRELAILALGRQGTVPIRESESVEKKLMKHLFTPKLSNNEFFKILQAMAIGSNSFSKLKSSIYNDKVIKGDMERQSFVTQKLTTIYPDLAKNYHTQSVAGQGQSVFVSKPVLKTNELEGRFTFATCLAGDTLTRTSFGMTIKDGAGVGNDLLTIDSFIGGLSGVVGQQDPKDDPDLNAKISVSMLGLPLRPFVLFDSMGDLISMYWSGELQEKNVFIQAGVPLLQTKDVLYTELGHVLSLDSSASIFVQSTGHGDVSIWESSGTANVRTRLALEAESNLKLRSGDRVMSAGGHVRIDTGLRVLTEVQMGSGLVACVKMETEDLEMRHRLTQSAGEKLTVLPGVTWNINQRNNEMCNRLART